MAAAADAAKSNALLAMNKVNNTKCRACLSVSRQTVKLDAKIADLQNVRTYGQGLRQCTNIPLTTRSPDGYRWPMQICVRCCRALEVAMHFVELAIESNRKLFAESQSLKTMPSTTTQSASGELKRKASSELLHWNQFSQEFEQFVESYDGVSAPIEENVLYMRGAKVPRLDADIAPSNEPPKEDDVILFDVKYDSNDQDQEDENDGSDAKNSETFYDNSITNNNNTANKNNENNNNYNFNNKNGDMSGLPDVECDLIQRALFMTLNDDASSNQTAEALQSIESIKATLLKSADELTGTSASFAADLPIKSMPSKDINTNIPLLSCNICKHTHTEAKQMRIHYMRVHNCDVPEDDIIGLTKNQSFKCRPCNSYETNSRTDMQQHLIEHHKIDGDFEMYCYVQQTCPACGRIFKDQRSARTHYTRMHTPQQQQHSVGNSSVVREFAEQQHVCTACDKLFNSKGGLQAHQRFCQVKQPVHCNFCEQQFSSMRKYELHLQQQHAVDTLHECEICLKSFKSSDLLAVHRKRHSERHYQCPKCSLNYINAAELRVHYERAHVHEESVVSCRSCDNKFQNYALLREHEQRNHQKPKIWRCDNCNFETNTRARLRQHQYEHTDYPYKCIHCSEEFADRGKMRQHSKKVHAVELSDDQLAEMFRERIGYTNRHDAFSKTNNSLEIPGFSDDCFMELKNLGLDYDDITTDLFSNSISALDNLLELVP